jgi:hypothetical protein
VQPTKETIMQSEEHFRWLASRIARGSLTQKEAWDAEQALRQMADALTTTKTNAAVQAWNSPLPRGTRHGKKYFVRMQMAIAAALGVEL